MADVSPGRAFYDRQVKYLEAGDVQGLIASQYQANAELTGFGLEVKGTEALLKHFTGYLGQLGYIRLVSTDKFMETGNSVMFEATVRVAAGLARVYDVFVLENGKASKHFTGMLSFTVYK